MERGPGGGSPGRILVVDDDESVRECVSMALADEGYEVVTAPNGEVALELVGKIPTALILLDIRMPVMDGWEFCRAYHQRPGPHAPIIAFSAARDAIEDGTVMCADDVLAKPFDLDQLLQLVGRYTGRG